MVTFSGGWVPPPPWAVEVVKSPVYHVGLFDLLDEPYPHYVHYYGDEPLYVPPTHFHFRSWVGATDCVWIVPGTLERRL